MGLLAPRELGEVPRNRLPPYAFKANSSTVSLGRLEADEGNRQVVNIDWQSRGNDIRDGRACVIIVIERHLLTDVRQQAGSVLARIRIPGFTVVNIMLDVGVVVVIVDRGRRCGGR